MVSVCLESLSAHYGAIWRSLLRRCHLVLTVVRLSRAAAAAAAATIVVTASAKPSGDASRAQQSPTLLVLFTFLVVGLQVQNLYGGA